MLLKLNNIFFYRTLQKRITAASSVASQSGKMAKLQDSSDSDSTIDEDDIFVLRKGKDEFEPVEGSLGMYYKVCNELVVCCFCWPFCSLFNGPQQHDANMSSRN